MNSYSKDHLLGGSSLDYLQSIANRKIMSMSRNSTASKFSFQMKRNYHNISLEQPLGQVCPSMNRRQRRAHFSGTRDDPPTTAQSLWNVQHLYEYYKKGYHLTYLLEEFICLCCVFQVFHDVTFLCFWVRESTTHRSIYKYYVEGLSENGIILVIGRLKNRSDPIVCVKN